ncbi:hypothetical protein IVA95_18730 [Bradyrhizobium sp. 157]|uniref:hypothetical protein n=1 Tax=Bradyrhizobium sp. 157 TaxID=2782631 RepID=UPI001FF7A2A4|nr:hypothetical protein [Bradyrhizobium sp. 157]MCK1639594.1 hypothetical protein [Bradyrhizobium sp. 157]
MTLLKERKSAIGVPSHGNEISLEVKARTDVANGMYEVSVTVDNETKGSSYILTSPRSLAFRKTG